MNLNNQLHKAKNAKQDEFYTQITDIENELKHYKNHFNGKVVLCNCDDPRVSNFTTFFKAKFEEWNLKKLICTCYKSQDAELFSTMEAETAVYQIYDGREEKVLPLKGDGDFRSQECIELLKEADIVVTNPPFSLFREYVAQLMEYNKSFIIIGNQNAITYKEIFTFLKENRLWVGYKSGDMKFTVPSYYTPRNTRFWIDEDGTKWRSLGNICWYTNLDIQKRHENLILYKTYNEEEYLRYDNYDAINVNKVTDIPVNYEGCMGVPITFLDKYNPEQFEIVKFRKGNDDRDLCINGKCPYFRIIIRKRKEE